MRAPGLLSAVQAPRAYVQAGGAVAVSFGPSQRAAWRTAPGARRLRASGGGAVLRGPWLLRALLVLPPDHVCVRQGPMAAGRWFGALHRDWLRAQGLDTSCHEGAVQAHPACFAGRAPGEVLVGGRKITGIAQAWRRGRVQLWSGTLLGPVPWALLCDALPGGQVDCRALEATTIHLQQCLGHRPDGHRWARGLLAHLRECAGAPQPWHQGNPNAHGGGSAEHP